MITSTLPIKTLSFLESIDDSEIADISYKILQFSKDTWELSLSPEQVITSIQILNIQNSTQTRVNQIQSNCIHLYDVLHMSARAEIHPNIWKTIKKTQTLLALVTLCHYLSTDFKDGWKNFEYQLPHISRKGTTPQQ